MVVHPIGRSGLNHLSTAVGGIFAFLQSYRFHLLDRISRSDPEWVLLTRL
jgi:hypothetical protein